MSTTKRGKTSGPRKRSKWLPPELETVADVPETGAPAPAPRGGDWTAGTPSRSKRAKPSPWEVTPPAAQDPEEPEREKGSRRRRLVGRGSPKERWLLSRLRRSQAKIERQREEIEELKRRLGEKTESITPKADGSEKLDLNGATVEELRAAGLTVTQSKRLVSHRERAGRLQSIEDLEEISGFGKATIRKLRPRVRVTPD